MLILLRRRISSSQIIVFGFALLILCGALLLMLPAASKEGIHTSFSEALFTAVSCVCVTGLVVRDTATTWSFFGQVIILILIQIGGMGVVTLAVVLSSLSGKKISLKERSTMQEALSAPTVGGIVRFSRIIVLITICIELIGAICLSPVFIREFSLPEGLWYALFHSVSAFCNAGFDLMGKREPYSSLTFFAVNPVVNLTICLLIIIGGIGFMTWKDFWTYRLNFKKYRMQSKVILLTTLLLIILPFLDFFIFEFSEKSLPERFWMSLFQTVTPRTAGFNTADYSSMSEGSVGLTIILMLIGGSPGSTAGGMKTTTLAVLLSTALAVFRRGRQTHFFSRRVTEETIRNAAAILVLYLTLFLSTGIAISRLEHLPLLTCLFETASAIGTVGLTLGITPGLGIISRMMLILLMFCGRVGGLTLIFSTFTMSIKPKSNLPSESLNVG